MSSAQTSCPQYCSFLPLALLRISESNKGATSVSVYTSVSKHFTNFSQNQLFQTILWALIIRELSTNFCRSNIYATGAPLLQAPATINFVVPCRYMDICMDIYSPTSPLSSSLPSVPAQGSSLRLNSKTTDNR